MWEHLHPWVGAGRAQLSPGIRWSLSGKQEWGGHLWAEP